MRPARFPPKACSTSSSAARRAQARQAPPQANFFSDPFRRTSSATGASAASSAMDLHVLRAQLRRQIFSADLARQRHAGGAVPGVLSGRAPQVYYGGGIDDATASNGERYADSERLYLPQSTARRLHLRPAPQDWRRSISRSTPRCAPATWLPPPMAWLPSPASGSAPARPPTSPRGVYRG